MNMKSLFVLFLVLISAIFISGCLSGDSSESDEVGTKSFKSEKEMKAFFESSEKRSGNNIFYNSVNVSKVTGTGLEGSFAPAAMDMAVEDSDGGSRYSGTNVQVSGVDEADIVKTDGKFIYYSPDLYYPTDMTFHEDKYYSYYNYNSTQMTYIINAFPPETANIVSNITNSGGSLYLYEDTLLTIDFNLIQAYDIKDPSAPQMKWKQEFDGGYVNSRMIDGELYLVTQDYKALHYPIVYMEKDVSYENCYYPYGPDIIMPDISVTYYISKTDVSSGQTSDVIALIGSYSTIMYASENNLYLTNYYYPDTQKIELNFIVDNGGDYFPSHVMKEIKTVMGYDLSDRVKSVAIDEIIYNYASGLSEEEAVDLNERYYKDYNAYSSRIIEEAEKTTVTKIDLKTFDVTSGFVQGRIKDSFSMNEHDGYLHVIATAGNNWRTETSRQETSVYVFDSDMRVAGELNGLAPREDVKSSRYVGDRLYLVTYEQIDPFFVIDLSDPQNPQVLGELKLPGYSTYMHPLSETLVLGVGETGEWRDRQYKLTLFDVTDVHNPDEIDSYYFDSDQYIHLYDHHSFLWDAEKSLIVIPGYEHAYILEVKDDIISLIKDDYHKNASVQRSLYIDDYLYIFSSKEIHVYDQNTWSRVKTIEIPQPVYPDYSVYPPVYFGPLPVTVVKEPAGRLQVTDEPVAPIAA